MGDTRARPCGAPAGLFGLDSSLRGAPPARRSRYWFSWRCASDLSISNDDLLVLEVAPVPRFPSSEYASAPAASGWSSDDVTESERAVSSSAVEYPRSSESSAIPFSIPFSNETDRLVEADDPRLIADARVDSVLRPEFPVIAELAPTLPSSTSFTVAALEVDGDARRGGGGGDGGNVCALTRGRDEEVDASVDAPGFRRCSLDCPRLVMPHPTPSRSVNVLEWVVQSLVNVVVRGER